MSVAIAVKKWTLEELHSLPDDGNKYELIHGELFVTPAPTDPHETVSAKLTRKLDPFVEKHGLGYVYHPRAVVRVDDSEVEPDLMVRLPNPGGDWARAPIPSLIVEVLSPSTRRRDRNQKREFYLEVGVPDYWIVDPETRANTSVRPGAKDVAYTDRITWSPAGASEPLVIEIAPLFE